MYSDLAEIYDSIYHFRDYRKDAGYVIELIKREMPTAQTVLETACGTGLYLEQLQQHFGVEGLDLSPQMLARARDRLKDVPLHQGDMRSFDLDRRYDVVCCLFRSIAFVKTREGLIDAIGAMARHVAPGGLLLVEPFFTPEAYWVDRVTLNDVKSDQLKIAWMYVSEREGLVARQMNHFLVGTPAGVRHITELHELGLFTPKDFDDAFRAAGLPLQYDSQGPTGIGMYWGARPS